MTVENPRRQNWVLGGVALLLVIVLLELPWYTVGGGTVSGISLPPISNPATGSPGGFLGMLAVLATLAVLLDVVLEQLSPETNVPSVSGSRTMTRFLLAIAAAAFFALKFILNLSKIGNFGVGCWLGLVLMAALVFFTTQVRHRQPVRTGAEQEGEAEAEQESEGDREDQGFAAADVRADAEHPAAAERSQAPDS
jgi:uncharacterized membrane protein